MYSSSEGRLRPIQPTRDLGTVADLVELCFHTTLDVDGRNYLKQMRETARRTRLLGEVASIVDSASLLQASGFVWEVEGRLVGNLSLIPFHSQGRRTCLIANVAVHPDYRGRGIARALTAAALDHLRQRKHTAAWLQVREDNPPAIHLYQKMGFLERARRTAWHFPVGGSLGSAPPEYVVCSRRRDQWSLQKEWLERLYPRELAWHLPVDWNLMKPGFHGLLYRFFSLNNPRHWTVSVNGELAGALTWLQASGSADTLLLAAPPECDSQAIQALLVQARQDIPSRRRLSLNCPAGFAAEAILAAGFFPQQTLIWMAVEL